VFDGGVPDVPIQVTADIPTGTVRFSV
jgi:hypothetical protein